jgi:outer membrane protein OmpA-like peptidoglycan-associated protein
MPIVLRWRFGDTTKRMIRIAFPVETTSSRIAEKLSTTGRAEVYGIYFDFAKSTIRPESEPVLKEIADVMGKNPAWKLSVEGHTDNIGGAASNQDLSVRRAAAVRQALVDRYHVGAGRLEPAGFGASRPKETNDTLEGRARNRRVELVRQGSGQ